MNTGLTNLEEFNDPANYDIEEGEGTRRRALFYAEFARRTGEPVLEIACGSGLALIPLAELGFGAVGVDLARPMLEQAWRKSQEQGLAVEWVEADGRHFDLGRQFPFIFMTGNAFQAFLRREDQEALLAAVRRHLTSAGLFAFETRNPSGHDLDLHEAEEHWGEYTNIAGQRVHITGTQAYDPISQVMLWTTYRRWQVDGRDRETVTRIACRFTHPQELEALLHYNGFEIAEQFGDWDKGPLTASSEAIISICRLRATDKS